MYCSIWLVLLLHVPVCLSWSLLHCRFRTESMIEVTASACLRYTMIGCRQVFLRVIWIKYFFTLLPFTLYFSVNPTIPYTSLPIICHGEWVARSCSAHCTQVQLRLTQTTHHIFSHFFSMSWEFLHWWNPLSCLCLVYISQDITFRIKPLVCSIVLC